MNPPYQMAAATAYLSRHGWIAHDLFDYRKLVGDFWYRALISTSGFSLFCDFGEGDGWEMIFTSADLDADEIERQLVREDIDEPECPNCGAIGKRPVEIRSHEFQGVEGHGGIVTHVEVGCTACAVVSR